MESASPVVLCAIPLAAIVTAVYSILSVAINVFPPIRTETISLENDYVALSNQLEVVVKSNNDNSDTSRSLPTGCIQAARIGSLTTCRKLNNIDMIQVDKILKYLRLKT
jgi:hypothetical protein